MKKILNKFKTTFFILLTLSARNSFAANDGKPYQLIDGKIDGNIIQVWRSFRRDICALCHEGTGQGITGTNHLLSLAEKIDKTKFKEMVTN